MSLSRWSVVVGLVLASCGEAPPLPAPQGVLVLSEARVGSVLEQLEHAEDGRHLVHAPEADIDRALDQVEAVAVDLSALEAGQLEALRPLLHRARDRGASLILEQADDAAQVASLIGLGLSNALLVVEPDGQGSYRIDALGPSDAEVELIEDGEAPLPLEAWQPTAQQLAQAVSGVLAARGVRALSRSNDLGLPTGTYAHYLVNKAATEREVDMWAYSGVDSDKSWGWHEDQGLWRNRLQTLVSDVDFELFLVASDLDDAKYLFINTMGTGWAAVDQPWLETHDLGYFLVRGTLSVDVDASDQDLAVVGYTPDAPTNSGGSYSRSTGWEVSTYQEESTGTEFGFSKDGLSVGVSSSSTSGSAQSSSGGLSGSVNLVDYQVLPNSSGNDLEVSWEMSHMDGGAYSPDGSCTQAFHYNGSPGSSSELQRYTSRSLPAFARSSYTPHFESVYRADQDLDVVVPITLSAESRYNGHSVYHDLDGVSIFSEPLVDLLVDGSSLVVAANSDLSYFGSSWKCERSITTVTVDSELLIDFSAVAAVHGGTAPLYDYLATIDPNDWLESDPAGTAQWVHEGHWIIERTGASESAYIREHTQFRDGSYQILVWPEGAGGSGLVYSAVDKDNRYQAEVGDDGTARLVKIEAGARTELGAVANTGWATDRWNTLRIERDGRTHRLYVGSDPLPKLIVDDNTFGTGMVGLLDAKVGTTWFKNMDVRSCYPSNEGCDRAGLLSSSVRIE